MDSFIFISQIRFFIYFILLNIIFLLNKEAFSTIIRGKNRNRERENFNILFVKKEMYLLKYILHICSVFG